MAQDSDDLHFHNFTEKHFFTIRATHLPFRKLGKQKIIHEKIKFPTIPPPPGATYRAEVGIAI